MEHIVIIGNGISGVTAARNIRKLSKKKITIISSESEYFFSRTALMYVFMGHMKMEHTQPYENDFWKKNNINLVFNHVKDINSETKTIYFSELTIEEDNIRNYTTTALSWVRLRFINQSPSPSDVLQYSRQIGKINCSTCCPAGTNYLNGAIDTSIYCVNDGNTTYQYQYSVVGTTNNGIKSATTIAFDTTEILLQY